MFKLQGLSLTATIFVAEVGETPDIGQIDGKANDGEQEVDLAAPGFPLVVRVARTLCALGGRTQRQMGRGVSDCVLVAGGVVGGWHRQGDVVLLPLVPIEFCQGHECNKTQLTGSARKLLSPLSPNPTSEILHYRIFTLTFFFSIFFFCEKIYLE